MHHQRCRFHLGIEGLLILRGQTTWSFTNTLKCFHLGIERLSFQDEPEGIDNITGIKFPSRNRGFSLQGGIFHMVMIVEFLFRSRNRDDFSSKDIDVKFRKDKMPFPSRNRVAFGFKQENRQTNRYRSRCFYLGIKRLGFSSQEMVNILQNMILFLSRNREALLVKK